MKIKKILVMISFLALALILVACGGEGVKVDYVVVSPDKITYDGTDITNEVFAEGHPRVDINTVDLYAVMTDGSVVELTEKSISTTVLLGDGVYNISIRTRDNIVVTYQVYVYNPDDTGLSPKVSAINFTTGNVEDVAASLVTILANNYSSENIEVLVGLEDGSQISEEAIFDNTNFDMFTHSNQIIKVSSESLQEGIDYRVKVVKPADNNIPIRTEYANFWDWVFIVPVAFLMQLFASIFCNSFAVGIFFATIIIRTLAWPIYAKSNDLSLRMSIAQPEMTRIQEKYATRQDPASKQKMQLELMQVYKKHKINMLGCLTPILQMPIFLAMYQTVHRITVPGGMYADKVSNTNFLWMDLSRGGEVTSSLILAGLVGLTMYLLQVVSQKRPDHLKKTGTQNQSDSQAQQQKTMKIVSFVMIGFMTIASFAYNALAFYWLIGNLYSLGQTLLNRKLQERKAEKLRSQL